jgi:hypothetical protein
LTSGLSAAMIDAMQPVSVGSDGPGPSVGDGPGPILAVGIARLPRAVAGESGAPLMVELTVDHSDGVISDVATTVPLPGYTALLKGVLIGVTLDRAEAALRRVASRLCGPLLKPTIAAVANAAANGLTNGS